MGEPAQEHHISSAVVSVIPEHADDVVRKLEAMADTEVHHRTPAKIIIVLEGPSENAIGGRLAQIALLDHVLSANLVYEIIDTGAADTTATAEGGQP
ncbi:chaperone NapD [Rhizobiales bacterium]|uniref:chaperone NapD n=1 Tax=Hongsoonwoonella zoysiae TaxID=2821844 RepID=UPI0015607BB4|nr:chaperone NapD [Hongsoonwoonella zoysiae]NRG18190.1 chaperone NapD [Hongsoonwoonella zoysiae]